MHKTALLFCLLLLSFRSQAVAVGTDYGIYHGMINRAEEAMFLRGDYPSAKRHYDSAFAGFGFVFSKDCMIAAQLALVNKDEKSALQYLHKGFEGGLKVRDLSNVKRFNTDIGAWQSAVVFDTLLAKPGMRKRLEQDYAASRKKYFTRINVPLRITMDSVFIFDQVTKNNQRGKTAANPDFNFVESRLDAFYDSLVRTVGFPGEKLIGLDDHTLMEELGRGELGILRIYDRKYAADSAAYNVRRSQFDPLWSLSASVPIIPLLHNSCSWRNLQPYFETEIKKGNLHPRDGAYLLDFFKSTSSDESYRACKRSDMPLRYFTDSHNVLVAGGDLAAANEKRAELQIVSMETDQAKARYARKHGLVLFFGFFDHL